MTPQKVRIKQGAQVQIQGKLVEAPQTEVIFDAQHIAFTQRWSLTAYSFGQLGKGEGAYGRGPIIAMSEEDLWFISRE